MNITDTTFAEYRDHMGSDLTVVNAARASFGKESEWETNADGTYAGPTNRLKPEDANLIRFLATGYRTKEWEDFLDEVTSLALQGHFSPGEGDPRGQLTDLLHAYKRKPQHWAPFGHPHVQLRVSMPIFLARQFVKHQVGGVWSEESRRYISDEPGVYIPKEWHTRPADIKQGSGGLVKDQKWATGEAIAVTEEAVNSYQVMVRDLGVAPEEARTILPLNMMTAVVWTGSLLFWSRVVNQRVDGHAQLAARVLGKQISAIVGPLFPVSWKELTGRTE
jgi:thymidylate synthase (FAD)